MKYPRPIHTFSAEGFTTTAYEESEGGRCHMWADMDIDVDGSGDSHGDPYFQPDTTLHYKGKPLNSDEVAFIVLPAPLIVGVRGIVLGCLGRVTYKDKSCWVVVGDEGPTRKVGEASRKVAIQLHIPPSPINGGIDMAEVYYEWYPGKAAFVDGVQYDLQRHK